MKSFHFDLGNSTKGPIGFCAVVKAKTEKEALALLKAALPTDVKIDPCGTDEQNSAVEYIEVYFNDKAITLKDIDEENDVDDDEESEDEEEESDA